MGQSGLNLVFSANNYKLFHFHRIIIFNLICFFFLLSLECFLIDDEYDGTERFSTTCEGGTLIYRLKSSAMTNNNNKNEFRRSANNFDKFRLLMWKNWLLQKRNKIQTIAELLIPIILVVILVVIRGTVQPIEFKNATTYKPFQLSPWDELE